MKKFILKLEVQDVKDKRKAMKTVSTLPGIDTISIDMKDKKLTVIGTVDPVSVVSKLRKFWRSTDIISVGPAKEPEKEEPKKEEPKKGEEKEEEGKEEAKKENIEEEPKKEEGKKEETKKEEGEKKTEPPQPMVATIMPYRPYYPPVSSYYPSMSTYYPPMNAYYNPAVNTNYYAQPVVEESPSTCTIC
ncbi:uncharacterized protein LOC141661145 isoform X1 [Apium graveolens]|uniref:uncharacterized protein LOC141661145 isoform X1 n=2 Tax=Apium graveolens TaxID=4045 RepID=UPI003D7A28D6